MKLFLVRICFSANITIFVRTLYNMFLYAVDSICRLYVAATAGRFLLEDAGRAVSDLGSCRSLDLVCIAYR